MKEKEKREYRNGLYYKHGTSIVLSADPYNSGVAKYQNKSTNYESIEIR